MCVCVCVCVCVVVFSIDRMLFCTVADETHGVRTVEERQLERRTESTTYSHNFYLHCAKSLHAVAAVKDRLCGKSLDTAAQLVQVVRYISSRYTSSRG